MKAITRRLSKVMTTNKVLNPNNWAALPGGNTYDPIHILNNDFLYEAMRRIKISEQIVKIIDSVLESRQNKVITYHGLTEPYKVHDGIDQGDAISPLLWRIYYDPLLDAMEKSELGYTMSAEHIQQLNKVNDSFTSLKLYATVYMDDTVWIANSRSSLQKMLRIAEEFCEIVDISINAEKSQVLHICPKKDDELLPIQVKDQQVIPVKKSMLIRYLGVWLQSEPYKVHDGIDQGDAISPLLWRIYYDPLLDAMEKSELGYTMSAEHIQQLNKVNDSFTSLKLYATVYMDDTVWIANSRSSLQKMLRIAEEFCEIVDISINAEKSQVLHICPKKDDELLPIQVKDQQVIPVKKSMLIRYLGVWLQSATDKLVRYILNHVTFPQIEYLLKDMVLSESVCNTVNSTVLQFFKNKVGFVRSAMNSIFFMSEGYKLFNIQNRQIQMHGVNWLKRVNADNDVGLSTRIRLQQYQNATWHHKSILNSITIVNTKIGHNLIGDILGMLKAIDFKFHICTTLPGSLTFPSGGFILIAKCKDIKWFKKYCQSLKNRRIMFFDQLFNIDFSTFLHWPHLLTFIKGATREAIPGWYNDLEALHNTPTIRNKLIGMKEFHNFINPFIDMYSPFKTKDGVWYSQKDKGQYNIGKLTRERSLEDVLVDDYIAQHFVQVSRELEPTSIVKPCEKCPININTKGNDPRCLIAIDKSESIQIPVKKSKNSTSNTRHNQMEKRIVMPAKDIRKMHQIINEVKIEDTPYNNCIMDEDIDFEVTMFVNSKRKFLESKFMTEKVTVNKLIEITSQLRHLNNITVYTDSSCKDFDGQYGMGLGWIISESMNSIENDIRFKCYADHFPSSTKAELLAIITALAVASVGSVVNVFTDSQNVINIIEEIVSNRDRDIQWTKGKKIISRNAILHMIKDLDLTVQCHKVKTHSNDKYNEEIDSLARITWNEIFSGERIQVNIQAFNIPMIIPLWRGLALDISIKDTLQSINEYTWTQKWLNQNRIKWWITRDKARRIYWKFTAKSIHPSKITTFKSDFRESKFRQFSLKLLNDELPTMNNLHKRNFTNENPFKELKEKFIRMTHFEANKIKPTLVLSKTRERLQTVTENWENQKATAMEYSWITLPDIIIGLVPNSFVTACKELTGDSTLGAKVVIKSIYAFKKHLFGIWKQRCERLILWEKSKNITTNDKRSNKLKFVSNNSLTVIEREVDFDDITGAPLHNASVVVTPVSRQQYSYILNEASLNALTPVQGATMSCAVN
ncbi:hypothetical protein Glove_44g5 [Diversispora epigaea]|uniref:RNase H type-1 domain-containing protein n=1 Tax=Diversispora epigaea TaxID=1348612 RepID=A0A397JLG3_9GLOM|nr:hypothetical protein Glove_44g5 [Diversispora epigaea]